MKVTARVAEEDSSRDGTATGGDEEGGFPIEGDGFKEPRIENILKAV